jgi:hypothetical protein
MVLENVDGECKVLSAVGGRQLGEMMEDRSFVDGLRDPGDQYFERDESLGSLRCTDISQTFVANLWKRGEKWKGKKL